MASHRKEINALTTSLKEQAAQIQKINAQLNTIKPTPQIALNSQ